MFFRNNILLFFIIITFPVIASNPKIDSLKAAMRQAPNLETRLDLYSKIANEFYKSQIHYDSAFIYLQEMRKEAISGGNKKMEAYAVSNQALIYDALKDYQNALFYLKEGLPLYKSLEDPIGVMNTYNNLGLIYNDLDEHDNALVYMDSALTVAKKEKLHRFIGFCYTNLGEGYLNKGEYGKAKSSILLGIEILDSLGIPHSIPNTNLAKAYLYNNEPDLAERQAKMALETAREEGKLDVIYETSMLLADIHEKNKNYIEMVEYTKMAMIYNDSISQATGLGEIEKLVLQFEYNEQTTKLKHLEQKNQLMKTIYFLLAVGVFLLIVLVLRQVKIIRMTRNIHQIQNDLIKQEMELRDSSRHATGYDATIAGDNELI